MGFNTTTAVVHLRLVEVTSEFKTQSYKLLAYSSSLLARLWNLDVLSQKSATALNSMHDPDSSDVLVARSAPPPSFTPLPGPWGFLTSGYIIGLIVMAVLMHRIQNIVVPPRHQFAHRFARPPQRHGFFQAVYRTMFPLDFSSSLVRVIMRLPSLYLVAKSLLLWTIVFAQTADQFPCWDLSWLQSLGCWAAQQEMASLCWTTFCSVCGALCIEALTRGLEGGSSSASPFNLFGYAFLLHIYSSPMTHGTKLEGSPSRPDKHVVLTIMLPLFQLAIVHCLGIKQRWSNHRLVPSTFVSLLGLMHFHWVLWFSDSSYPLLNYMPCLFESILLFVTLLAIFLNVLTQVVTEGSVSRPLFGHHAVLLPRWDEDFSVALLRMGTGSLEASSVAGLGNEVGTVAALTPSTLGQTEFGTVELSRSGVSSISHPYEGYGKDRRMKKGFANEIKSVKATSTEGDLWLDMTWYREFARFGVGVARVIKAVFELFWSIVRRRPRLRPPSSTSTDMPGTASPDERPQAEQEDEEDVYDRFTRGEAVSDDEYDEYEPIIRSRSESTSSASSRSDTGEDTSHDDQFETVGLYADLSATSVSASASLLLAHMIDNSSSPLTRRRFNRLVPGPPSNPPDDSRDDWAEVIRARRIPASAAISTPTEDQCDETRRNCVICIVEPRQIICWPCRCLALCDDCRENLATRTSSSKHTCPCCRRNVEGYSKIYIP
ncbi:hypothetical protein BDN67DRAFT_962924 [Paxillus ammoniavirescens]|nr:hypothetical protein BDN67DRAFT_962924 [Paxillus ammoniavirescens]